MAAYTTNPGLAEALAGFGKSLFPDSSKQMQAAYTRARADRANQQRLQVIQQMEIARAQEARDAAEAKRKVALAEEKTAVSDRLGNVLSRQGKIEGSVTPLVPQGVTPKQFIGPMRPGVKHDIYDQSDLARVLARAAGHKDMAAASNQAVATTHAMTGGDFGQRQAALGGSSNSSNMDTLAARRQTAKLRDAQKYAAKVNELRVEAGLKPIDPDKILPVALQKVTGLTQGNANDRSDAISARDAAEALALEDRRSAGSLAVANADNAGKLARIAPQGVADTQREVAVQTHKNIGTADVANIDNAGKLARQNMEPVDVGETDTAFLPPGHPLRTDANQGVLLGAGARPKTEGEAEALINLTAGGPYDGTGKDNQSLNIVHNFNKYYRNPEARGKLGPDHIAMYAAAYHELYGPKKVRLGVYNKHTGEVAQQWVDQPGIAPTRGVVDPEKLYAAQENQSRSPAPPPVSRVSDGGDAAELMAADAATQQEAEADEDFKANRHNQPPPLSTAGEEAVIIAGTVMPPKARTEMRAKAYEYWGRMTIGEAGLQSSIDAAGGVPDVYNFFWAAPSQTIGGMLLGNAMASSEAKGYMASAQLFLNAILRRDSGAAVPLTEYPQYWSQFIPLPNDDPQTLMRKKWARKSATDLMKKNAGLTPSELLEATKREAEFLVQDAALREQPGQQSGDNSQVKALMEKYGKNGKS